MLLRVLDDYYNETVIPSISMALNAPFV